MHDRNLRAWVVLSVAAALASCGGDGKSAASGDTPDERADEGARCEAICARSEAADCENEAGDCEQQCASLRAQTPAHCASRLSAFTRCAASARFTCDADGESQAPSCAAELDAWIACAEPAAGDGRMTPQIDAGVRGANTSMSAPDARRVECPLGDDENVCSTCLKFSCCEQISACGPACQALVACVNACPASPTDACGQACITAHPGGAPTFSAFAQCLAVPCEAACSASGAGDASVPGSATSDARGNCMPRGSVAPGRCDLDDGGSNA